MSFQYFKEKMFEYPELEIYQDNTRFCSSSIPAVCVTKDIYLIQVMIYTTARYWLNRAVENYSV